MATNKNASFVWSCVLVFSGLCMVVCWFVRLLLVRFYINKNHP
jgi:hypothetical protein